MCEQRAVKVGLQNGPFCSRRTHLFNLIHGGTGGEGGGEGFAAGEG